MQGRVKLDETPAYSCTASPKVLEIHISERIERSYLVRLQPEHTVAKHFLFLGFEFEFNDLSWLGYGVKELDDDKFRAVMRDPGVVCIEDNIPVFLDAIESDSDTSFGIFD